MIIQRRLLSPVLLAVALSALAPRQTLAEGQSCECKQVENSRAASGRWIGQWYVLETDNFEVCCEKSEAPAKVLAERAEALRSTLVAKWLGSSGKAEAWHPRCQVFLYATKRNYVAAVGPGSERTVGSSLVNVDKGRIVSRSIDLSSDQVEFMSAALPHELTHVILRDRFTSAPPRWADEGMATLADTDAKQSRHRKDLIAALADGTTFRAANLLAMEDYPPSDRIGAFYGESVSLTQFLVDRATPQQFVDFVELASQLGYDAALQSCYGINGARELDRQWRQSINPIQLASYSGH